MFFNSDYLLFFAICVGLIILFVYLKRKFKFPKVGSLCLVSGGVKCGKSTFAVALAIKEYKRSLRSVKFVNFFRKLFKKSLLEEPLLYSNIPLAVPYVPLTEDLLLRKRRFRYRSIIYVCEASLVCDSQCIKDLDLNERLLLFNKLIGHETLGGKIIYDTQSVSDNHYSVKRCLSEYIYIHNLTKWLPFFLVATVREERYSDDGAVVNSYNDDVELSLRRVIIPKSVWKKFDAYTFSKFTDNLSVADDVRVATDLKSSNIVSFKTYKHLYGGSFDEKTKS